MHKFSTSTTSDSTIQTVIPSGNAFKAAVAYMLTFLMSLFYLKYNEEISNRWSSSRRVNIHELYNPASGHLFGDAVQSGGYGTFEMWRGKMIGDTRNFKDRGGKRKTG